MPTPRNEAIRNTALLRNRILTCVLAAERAVTVREVAEWPSVAETIPSGRTGISATYFQLKNLAKQGELSSFTDRGKTFYGRPSPSEHPQAAPTPIPSDLRITVDRAKRTLRFQFAGLAFTIEVVT